ncbi:MBL fold metallo-hydrolase [Kutzneria kofuensis]|uniref:MBL fold metallo-hydrolase n=1 Tax=Kutzneria kofuensis TaxID=103725 RepID=UPI0028AE9F9F|nr:MBL fold metallo-hydrolase [Kutzneria kofuensis]
MWLPESGGWGHSNSGLVAGTGESLLVDTLFDVASTSRLLTAMQDVVATAPVERVVNTHGNGDHWFGNQLLSDREIIAAAPTAAEMRAVGPAEVRALLAQQGRAGAFARRVFRGFDLSDVEPVYPATLYVDELDLVVGGTDVRLIDVGPAHTAGDTIVHVPSAGVVYTGDIVFAGGTPIVWTGPIGNWLRACDLICELGVCTVVPGHGLVTTVRAVRAQAAYLRFVQEEAAARHEKGMTFVEAAQDIDLREYGDLPEHERLVVNVHAVYRELDPDIPALEGPSAFACMGEFMEDLV